MRSRDEGRHRAGWDQARHRRDRSRRDWCRSSSRRASASGSIPAPENTSSELAEPRPTIGLDGRPRPKRALVFSGGGARGAYEAGVVHYLVDELPKRLGHPVSFDILCGTSVGAVHACFLAATAELDGSRGEPARRVLEANADREDLSALCKRPAALAAKTARHPTNRRGVSRGNSARAALRTAQHRTPSNSW